MCGGGGFLWAVAWVFRVGFPKTGLLCEVQSHLSWIQGAPCPLPASPHPACPLGIDPSQGARAPSHHCNHLGRHRPCEGGGGPAGDFPLGMELPCTPNRYTSTSRWVGPGQRWYMGCNGWDHPTHCPQCPQHPWGETGCPPKAEQG